MKNLIFILFALISFNVSGQVVRAFQYIPDFVHGAKISKLKGDDNLMLIVKPDGYIDTLSIPTGGGSGTYQGNSPATVSLGGYQAGDNISGSYDDIIEKLLTPYATPSFTSFTMNQTSTVEVGTILTGSKTFSWSISNPSNVSTNTLDIYDVTSGSYLTSNISNVSPASIAIGSITKNTATSHSWRAEATNTLSNLLTSSNYVVNWRWKRYWGFDNNNVYGVTGSTNLTPTEINNGSGELATNYIKSFATDNPTGTQYFYYAIPVSFGEIDEIYINGFPSISAFTRTTVSHTNILGVATNYYLYVSNNKFNTSAQIEIQ